ncbi:hypothetical protein [Marinomonas posidonica]|uniref:Uncharacterized protein n=1 Tax=Marinomonas posidonica (strain CECT 7376 / NCIMB 14433 / IVIA-Po-181) TaxID=491952 RepID=F6CWG7_MARPP|nr:hypothetical protein [Marinomonas posidonica]AEF53222.1 hypothetical protein Mar181_0154 [Marinomonas posidonica IVIA-Po-181]
MIFNIKNNAFNDENKHSLNYMALASLRGRAFIDFNDEDSTVQDWIDKNDPELWTLIKEYTTTCKSNFKIEHQFEVVNNKEKDNWNLQYPIIKIEEAIKIIDKPYEIWLENGIDDRDFLLLLMAEEIKKYFLDKSDKNQIIFVGKGGLGEIKKHIVSSKDKNHIKNKVFVIFDSDKNKKDNISRQAKEVIEVCSENCLKHHCWNRRAIENYLPIEHLKNKLNKNDRDQKKYSAFLSMNQEQKYYYHMKRGLKDTSCKNSGLYDNIEEMIRENELYSGFGKGIFSKFIRLTNENKNEDEIIRRLIEKKDSSLEIKNLIDNLLNFTRLPS